MHLITLWQHISITGDTVGDGIVSGNGIDYDSGSMSSYNFIIQS